ncbi:MAG: asparagine synthase (glutamine-hydrolyzing) [Rhodocyclaceae bacterium]|nr:asparagine synthase (glutamine-hydrolyzing) [Rhodocyclaceae bacterium]
MCGIAFLLAPTLPQGEARARMALALERQAHRGPDDGRMAVRGEAVIGHRRLSIIDLAGSPQPMSDSTERYTLAFNGEIYNYAALRAGLADRWAFRTDGDTEVLLAGLCLEGAVFLERLEGMWAVALWDAERRELFLSRDRMGKKPLYVRELCGGGLACASELPSLQVLCPESWHEDLDSTADYLRYGYYMPGRTAWAGVREILPGHWARWSPDGRLVESPYWQLRVGRAPSDPATARAQLRQVFIDAVERRLVADVEVGAFLSGGIDSTLVCAVVRSVLDRPLKTFTIGFAEKAFDERIYAQRAAELLGTDHYAERLDAWREEALEGLLLDHVGQPFGDSSLLPTALVSQVASRHVKVSLSGDGGDELFSGYQRYQARSILRWYTRLPQGLRHLAESAIRALPEPMAHHSRSVLKKAHLFVDVVERQADETPYFAPLLYGRRAMARLAPDLLDRGHPPPAIPEQTRPDDIERMMLADALVYLPQDILLKVDRASMAHALEARAPFLDRAVVELAFSLPRPWHRRGIAGKRMLRETFADLLPDWLWQRRKQGFGVPIHAWFRGPLGERLLALAKADREGPIDAHALATLLDEHRGLRQDHGLRLWALYSYLSWRGQRA